MSAPVKHLETAKNYKTWWMIVGPELPDAETRVHERATITKISLQDLAPGTIMQAPSIQRMNAAGHYLVAHYPPRDEVFGSHRLQIDVLSDSQKDAVSKCTEIANNILTSLSICIGGGRYAAELRMILAPDGKQFSAYSEIISAFKFDAPTVIPSDKMCEIQTLSAFLDDDNVAKNSYLHLLTAWKLTDTPGSRPLERSILQHYVLSIETIVNAVANEIRKRNSDKVRLDERNFAAEFAAEFASRSDKPKAIREASTRLREISLQNALPKIDAVCELLLIDLETAKKAKSLYTLRSASLSHPGGLTQQEAHNWLSSSPETSHVCAADALSRFFLRQYCLVARLKK